MDDEHDVEVFERIPWESLEDGPDRRWLVYLLAGAAVLAAVGVSLGRQMGGTTPSPPATAVPTVSSMVESSPASTAAVPQESEPAETKPTWSEADLMALPADSVEMGAAAVAEWFVFEFFTRDDPGGDRSFVEWARTSRMAWTTASTVRATVLVRRLAAVGEEPYQRLDTESWEVVAELEEEGWIVVDGPIQGEAPNLMVHDSESRAEWAEGEVTMDAEWTDPAGVAWQIRQPAEGGR